MKQVQISAFGQFDKVLTVADVPTPSPVGSQVLVHIKLRPINPSDMWSIVGRYAGFRPKELPATPGLEGYGVIEAVGPEVTALKPGQRVIPVFRGVSETGKGSWQQYVVLDQTSVIPLPDAVPDSSAAQFFVNPVAALTMLLQLDVPKGEYIFQNAAGSALGRQLIAICKLRGIKTVNIVRRASAVKEIEEIGGDVVIATEGLDSDAVVEAIIKALDGKRPYAAIDCVAGSGTLIATKAVRNQGTVLTFGCMESATCQVDGPSLIFREVKVSGYWTSKDFVNLPAEKRSAIIGEVISLMAQGILVPTVGKVFPLEQVVEAVAAAHAGKNGKILMSS